MNFLRAAYDTVASRIVLAEAYRRGAWQTTQAQMWVAASQRDLIVRDLGTRFASGEYVLLKRKRSGQDAAAAGVGGVQVSEPGAAPKHILGGIHHFYETAAGGFADGTNPSAPLITGFNRNGTSVVGANGRGIELDDSDEAEEQRLFKKFSLPRGPAVGPGGPAQGADPPMRVPTPGLAVLLPVRLRGVLTSAGEMLENMNGGSSRLGWLVSAAMVGIGDVDRERSAYQEVVRYARTVVNRPVEQRAAFCCPWYVEQGGPGTVGTLHPVSQTVSEGQLSNGDLVTATVVGATVVFAVRPAEHDVISIFAVVAFDVATNLFTVRTPAGPGRSQWHLHRLAPEGLVHNGVAFTDLDTKCEATLGFYHRKSVAYHAHGQTLSMLGEAEESTLDNTTGSTVTVRAWVDDEQIDAVLQAGSAASSVTAKAIFDPTIPFWRGLFDFASVGKLDDATRLMGQFVQSDHAHPAEAIPSPAGPHYHLIPMKSDTHDYTSGFGPSIHSDQTTFSFTNEPGQWFVGCTPSRAFDGLECAAGYLQSAFGTNG